MRHHVHLPSCLILGCVALALLVAGPLSAADAAAPEAPATTAASAFTGLPWLDVVLGVVGIVNVAATALAALLPHSSPVAWIARIADLVNRIGLTVKPLALRDQGIKPPDRQ